WRETTEFLVSRRVLAVRDAFLHEIASLEHLERYEAIESRKCCISKVVSDCFHGCHSRGSLMVNGGDDPFALKGLSNGQVGSAGRGHGSGAQYVKSTFELRSEVLLEELPRSLSGAFDRVTCFLLHP